MFVPQSPMLQAFDQFMKKFLLAFALSALLFPSAPLATGQDVSIDFFYNNLYGGSWIEVGNYGYCWQPDVAVSDPSWRPYADGYWAYTDLGWTWVSYEDYGWATYHYGRWLRLADYGWIWVPGYEWGPAWVSWRFGGGYAGWAPLPPETEIVYESRPLTGQLDVEFDIGPACYNFVDVRYIGEPVLRSRIVDVNQNVTYINQTVNVTNITYKNKTVYNYGPDLNVVNQYSSRPIQKLKLERPANVDVATAAKSGGLTKVQGNALVVAAPMKINKPAKQLAPPVVKTKVAEAKVDKGWSVAGDANAQTQLKEKIKTQDIKKVPPPTVGGSTVAGGAGAPVTPSTSLAPRMAPAEKGKGKGKGKGKAAEQFQAGATASPAGALGSPTAGPGFPGKGKHKGKFGEQAQPGAEMSPMTSPGAATSPAVAPEYDKQSKGRRGEQFGATPPPTTGANAAPEGITAPGGKKKGLERTYQPAPAGVTSPAEQFNQPRGKHKQLEQPGMSPSGPQNTPSGPQGGPNGGGRGKYKPFEQQQPGMSPSGAEGAGPYGESRGKPKTEGVNVSPPGGGQPPTGQPGGQAVEGKHEGKGKGAATATPGPQ
jgi:hypothetical protein